MSLTNQHNMTINKFVLLPALLIAFEAVASDGCDSRKLDQTLSTVEVSGISMETPKDAIADILSKQGYTAITSSLFTKQEQLQSSRKTIYRIEVEETAAFRQISYHRSLSGGRVKSSVGEKPIPSDEFDTAQQLYQIACEGISEAIKAERECELLKDITISAGHGRFIELNARWAVQLNATAVNTAIGIKYSNE